MRRGPVFYEHWHMNENNAEISKDLKHSILQRVLDKVET